MTNHQSIPIQLDLDR